jgi:hypothetical protein
MNHARIVLLLLVVLVVAALGIFSSQPVAAHGGGLDGIGCHNDTKARNYHCHRGTCAGQTFASKAAAVTAGCKY